MMAISAINERYRKKSVKEVLSRTLDKDSLRFVKVFVSKRKFDKYPKIGILFRK